MERHHHLDGYDMGARIGGGNFSIVYKAIAKNGKIPVAIKCLNRGCSKRFTSDRAVKEIALMKELQHTNVVKLYDFQFDSKTIYIIMEMCTEGDLSMLLKKSYKLCESFLQIIMQQLAAALRFLRTKNICHMDLKPQNILLTRTPELVVKLADFGLSRILNEENLEQSRFAGSFRYMAPEKILNQKFDSRIDLWSVGIIMYECLVGRTPFLSTSYKVITENMVQQKIVQIPPSISLSTLCEDLLQSLLRYNPTDRIDFDEFFNHGFLKLNYLPCPENYERVKQLIKEASALEKEKKLSEALAKCKQAICYLEGFSCIEIEPEKKKLITQKLTEYKAWSEQITCLITQPLQGGNKTSIITCENHYQHLVTICRATPELQNAIEIGRLAEMYVLDGKRNLAFEKVTAALDTLIPLLNSEPPGLRKDMLHKQINQWLTLGELLKKSLE